MTFGKLQKKYRKDRGLTQVALSTMMHISRTTLCRYEKEKVTPQLDTAILISRKLGFSLDEIKPAASLPSGQA